MVVDRNTKTYQHLMMTDFPNIIPQDALLVFNDSRVRKARLFAKAQNTNAQVEFLLVDRINAVQWKVMAKQAKRRKVGERFYFPDGTEVEIVGTEGNLRILSFSKSIDDTWLDVYGHIPLPPYIKRPDVAQDEERYQTIYAKYTGSAAAPTAGLHFTEEILAHLRERGIEMVYITLHVGMGTFLPVRSENVESHVMHEETYTITETVANAIERAKQEGKPVVAIGTTSVRTLESAWDAGHLHTGEHRTDIFIYPGYQFKVVDQLFTNFHTPESTLLMLVSAFAGKDFILECYEEAIQERYRFFSYGDAMYIQ
jgi:S-adenosylmethionine:tRNA ribosyltransferase-isomerase